MSVLIYASGPAYCSVCAEANLPVADVEAAVNRQNPTGIDAPWRKADEPFAGGEPNPMPCQDFPSRLHYLMAC